MLITFKEVLSGLKRFGVSETMIVMINGCGPVGLSMVRLCKILGVSKLIVSETDDDRLAIAGKLGADIMLNPLRDDVEAIVKSKFEQGLDLFIDAVGKNELMNLGLKLVKFNGKVGVYGIAPKCMAEINWENAPYNWDIHFIQWPTFEEEAAVHDRIVEYVRCGALKLEDFVTHVLPLEDFNKGLDLVKSKKGLKVSLKLK
jgi:threonine dehydrogenase-like Zn-dependent dehydrogenase